MCVESENDDFERLIYI